MSYDDPQILAAEEQARKEQEAELHYLRWFYAQLDLGPGHDDFIQEVDINYTEVTGRPAPEVKRP